MTQQRSPSLLGGAMIIAGTAIGAGMLANPTSTAGVWFIGSILALIYTWFCMTTSGLMILEANLHYPTGSSFDTIVKDLLGKSWNITNGLSVAFVLYVLTYAYITSGGGITQNLLNQAFSSAESTVDIGRTSGSLIFCLILAAFVWLSTKAVDRFTTVLIVGMVVAFFPFYHWFIKLCKNRSFIQYSLSKRTNIFTLFIDRTSSLSRVLWFPRECSKSRQILRS